MMILLWFKCVLQTHSHPYLSIGWKNERLKNRIFLIANLVWTVFWAKGCRIGERSPQVNYFHSERNRIHNESIEIGKFPAADPFLGFCRNEIESLERSLSQLSFVFNWMTLYTLYHQETDIIQQCSTWVDSRFKTPCASLPAQNLFMLHFKNLAGTAHLSEGKQDWVCLSVQHKNTRARQSDQSIVFTVALQGRTGIQVVLRAALSKDRGLRVKFVFWSWCCAPKWLLSILHPKKQPSSQASWGNAQTALVVSFCAHQKWVQGKKTLTWNSELNTPLQNVLNELKQAAHKCKLKWSLIQNRFEISKLWKAHLSKRKNISHHRKAYWKRKTW